MPQGYTKALEVVLSEVWQSLQVDVVVSKRPRVLAKAKSLKPWCSIVCQSSYPSKPPKLDDEIGAWPLKAFFPDGLYERKSMLGRRVESIEAQF